MKGISATRLEFLPTLDFEVFHTSCGEGIDEGRSQSSVGEKRNVVIDGSTANLVAIGQFSGREVLVDVDHHFNFFLTKQV